MKIIQNPCNGIGDALVFCWLDATARANGITDFIINPVKHQWVFSLFGIQTDDSIQNPQPHPPKFSPNHPHWLASWLDGYFGLSGVTPVAPTHNLSAAELRWANLQWHTYYPHDKRTLCFPAFVRPDRAWPLVHWHTLLDFIPGIICTPSPLSGATTPNLHSLTGRQMVALIATADLVVCNDSGPAHFAGTLNKHTVVLHGPTDHNKYLGWYSRMHPIGSNLGCEGCNWRPGIYRPVCATGCSSMFTINPRIVAEYITNLIKDIPHDC